MAAGYVRLKKGRGRISTENSVSDDQLDITIRQVIQRLEHQHFEHQNRIVWLPARIAFAFLLVNLFQQWLEVIPVYDAF
jgi:hypothetical protein